MAIFCTILGLPRLLADRSADLPGPAEHHQVGVNSLPDVGYIEGFTAEFGEPCPRASKPTLPTLAARPEVFLPTGRVPDRWWLCDNRSYFMFGAIQVDYESGFKNVDPNYEVPFAAQRPGGYTVWVAGQSAAVFPSDGPDILQEVDLIDGDIEISLLARPDVPIQRLVDLLRTMPVPAAGS